MKKAHSIVILLLTAVLAAALTGCSGIVKIIPAGTESEYTGQTVFDAGSVAAGDWAAVAQEITAAAAPLADALGSAQSGAAYGVSFTGTVSEYNTDTPKGYLAISVNGVSDEVRVQVGSVYSGTTIRDAQTVKAYESFTNQTEWSAYAKTLNGEVQTNVVDPLGDLSALVGSTVEVVGCFTPASGAVVVTPVSIAVQ